MSQLASRNQASTTFWTKVAVAVVLVATGGAAIGLGASLWLAGSVTSVTALAGTVVVDRAFRKKDERAAALSQRDEVLDSLKRWTFDSQDSPMSLLHAELRTVPFRGRAQQINELASWCEDRAAAPLLILSGAQGAGKTRLALEFALTLPSVWAAGWLHFGAGGMAVSAVQNCGDPTLVLVDDADGRPDAVDLLNALAEYRGESQIRVIMLTRSDPGLRQWLSMQIDPHLQTFTESAQRLQIGIMGDVRDRQRWFEEALFAFADALRVEVRAIPRVLSAEYAAEEAPILVLHAQALLTVSDIGSSQPILARISPARIAEAMLVTERRRWRAIAATVKLELPPLALQEQCIASLALLGAVNETEASKVLQRIPDLSDASKERLISIASWAMALYPLDSRGALSIRPGMVGEWFVVSQLTTREEFATSLRSGLTDIQHVRALGFLSRAADTFDEAVRTFEYFASDDLRRVVLDAAAVVMAGDTGRCLLDPVLAERVKSAHEWTIEQLNELDLQIPGHLLVNTHAALSELVVALIRAQEASDPDSQRAELANALSNLSGRLSVAGKHGSSLRAIRESIGLWRSLVPSNRQEHEEGLAIALNNLGGALAGAGHFEAAVDAVQELVEIRRTPIGSAPITNGANLAGALHNLSLLYDKLGKPDDALAATSEAVDLWRAIVEADDTCHLADLASALALLAVRLDLVGKIDDALVAAGEAVELWRVMAEDNSPTHRAGLANALGTLSVRLEHIGEYRQALATVSESVELYRLLAKEDQSAYRMDLGYRLTNLGRLLRIVGETQHAVTVTMEAVKVWRRLVDDSPSEDLMALIDALLDYSASLSDAHKYQHSLVIAREAVRLCRSLDPAAYRPKLAVSLNNLWKALFDIDEYLTALKVAQEAVRVSRLLAATSPAHIATLANAIGNLAGSKYSTRDFKGALISARKSVKLWRRLAASDPDNYLWGLANSLYNLASALHARDRDEECALALEESLTIINSLPFVSARLSAIRHACELHLRDMRDESLYYPKLIKFT